MEIRELAENLGLDIEEFAEIFEIYKETTLSELEELKAALKAGDAQKVHEIAHSIKGASGNLGLDELFRLAKEIDDRARANSLVGLESLIQDFIERYKEVTQDFEKATANV
nr:Hpt domain-containing protein [Desulfobacterales bacterium]